MHLQTETEASFAIINSKNNLSSLIFQSCKETPLSSFELTLKLINLSHAKLFRTHTLYQVGGGGGVISTPYYLINP